jgi:hypothetical protein
MLSAVKSDFWLHVWQWYTCMQVRQLKAQLNQLSDQASQVKLDLASAKQETDILQDQIVQVGIHIARSGHCCGVPVVSAAHGNHIMNLIVAIVGALHYCNGHVVM